MLWQDLICVGLLWSLDLQHRTDYRPASRSFFSLLRLPTAAAFNKASPSSSVVGICPLWNDTDLAVIVNCSPQLLHSLLTILSIKSNSQQCITVLAVKYILLYSECIRFNSDHCWSSPLHSAHSNAIIICDSNRLQCSNQGDGTKASKITFAPIMFEL